MEQFPQIDRIIEWARNTADWALGNLLNPWIAVQIGLLVGIFLLAAILGGPSLAPESMIGSLAALQIPDTVPGASPDPVQEPLHRALYERHRIEVPTFVWPEPPRRLVRIAAQAYNQLADYERLARALRDELAAG